MVPRVAQVAQVRRRRVDRRDLRHLLPAPPRAESRRCGSRRRTTATTSPTRRASPGSRRLACARALRRSLTGTVGPWQRQAARREVRPRSAGTGTTAAASVTATSCGFTSCGISRTSIDGRSSPGSALTAASAQLVVPRSIPTMKRGATRVGLSGFRRLRPRLARQSGGLPAHRAPGAARGTTASRGGAARRGTGPSPRRGRPA